MCRIARHALVSHRVLVVVLCACRAEPRVVAETKSGVTSGRCVTVYAFAWARLRIWALGKCGSLRRVARPVRMDLPPPREGMDGGDTDLSFA